MKNKFWAIPLFFFVTALCLNAGNFLNSDEGTILNGAWKMYNGQKLYADFFSFYPPGSYYLVKWSFDFFGPSYWSAKFVSVLFLCASAWALYGIAMLVFANRKVAVVAAWVWIFSSIFPVPLLINYNTYSAYAALIAVFFLVRAVILRKKQDFFLTGIFTGGTMLFLQSKGAFLVFGLSAFLAWLLFRGKESISSLALFGVGASALPLIAVSVFRWRTLYDHLILWPRENYGAVNEVSWIPFFIAAALFVFLARRVFLRRMESDKTVFTLICIVQGVLLLSIFHRPDLSHLAWNSFGIILFGVYAMTDIYERGQSLFGRIMRRIAQDKPFIIGFIFFLTAFPFAINLISVSSELSFRKRAHDAGITQFYAHPFLPGMYFEFGIPDPYPYDVLVTSIHPKEAFESNLKQLEKHHPDYIFADYGMVAKFNYSTDNPLDRYIFSHYSVMDHWGSLTVLKRTK